MTPILSTSFMPHGFCYRWQPEIVWMHVLSDAVIAAAYFSIPVTLLYFLRLRPSTPFPAMIVLFAAFIVLCGFGHILEIISVWRPIYYVQGIEKGVTALVSIATAAAMIPMIPKLLAMRTPEESQQMVDDAVARLRDAHALLAEREKLASLGEVVAGVTHEVNTPLGIGVTAATTLQEMTKRTLAAMQAGTLKKSELEQFLRDASDAAGLVHGNLQRASELMQSFKQVAVDQASGERREIDVHQYLQEVVRSLSPALRMAKVKVHVEAAQDIRMDSFPGALAQIVANLVNNSLLHGFPNGRSGNIHLFAQQRGRVVKLRYSDDGVGMSESTLARVFEPYFTTKRGEGGSGLGMHIVSNLVTHTLGGRIEATSAPGKGFGVSIELPHRAPDPGQKVRNLVASDGHLLEQQAAHADAASAV